MNLTYDQLRTTYQDPEKLAQVLFSMLVLQEAKLERLQDQLAKPAQFKRRENRG